MPLPFVHLHLHSEYSMVDGTVRIKPLVDKARELGMPAIAITDQHNLFALVKFYRAAEAAGIKPIVGADVLIRSPEEPGLNFAPGAAVPGPDRLSEPLRLAQPWLPGRPTPRRSLCAP